MDKTTAIGWGTLALITAGIAESKGRSRLNWFILSAIFGPIALFFLVVVCDRLPQS